MCELFAMSSRFPTRVSSSLRVLGQHGGLTGPHRDGWGVAFYQEGAVQLIREPDAASRSLHLQFLQQRHCVSPLVMAHVRLATLGSVALKNTQPFCRELGGRTHGFAHNGDLKQLADSPAGQLRHYRPIGETDSERAFCGLLGQLAPLWRSPTPPSLEARFAVVTDFARQLRPLGPANFIYADSEFLFVHGHRRKQKNCPDLQPPGLWWLRRTCVDCPDAALSPPGEETDGPKKQTVMLVASVPLTDEPWVPLGEGEVLAIAHGTLVQSSHSGTIPPNAGTVTAVGPAAACG